MRWKTTRASLLGRVRDTTDHDAWSEFDELYGDLLLRYCRRRGLSLADAEDIRQIVLASLVRTLPTFEFRPQRGRFRGYLGRALKNAIARYRSSPKTSAPCLVPLEVVGEKAQEDVTAEDPVWEEEWRNHHLRRAFARVAEKHDEQSLAVFRELLEGRSVREVAASNDMTEAAVHKVKQRVRNRMREAIEEQLTEENER